uniref:Uncharacterized protein n=1 Tax=Lotharella globosa TaxID=91324 RepID=A0A7S3YRK0_9EUKA
MSEAMSVIIPTFPKDEESELACAVSVIFHSPGVSRPEQFKGEHKTWRAAYAALFQKLTTQFREGKDERALENLITMRDNQAATPEKYKQAYQQRKAEGIDVDIFTLDWPSTIVNVRVCVSRVRRVRV